MDPDKHKQLAEFISARREEGYWDESIKQELIKQGWNEGEVMLALAEGKEQELRPDKEAQPMSHYQPGEKKEEVDTGSVPVETGKVAVTKNVQEPMNEVKQEDQNSEEMGYQPIGSFGFKDLVNKTFEVFRQHWKQLVAIQMVVLVPVMMIQVFLGVVGLEAYASIPEVFSEAELASQVVDDGVMEVLTNELTSLAPLVGASILLALLAGFLSLWAKLATIWAVADDVQSGLGVYLKGASGLVFSYIWFQILLQLVMTGGYMLLIIPGIMVALWSLMVTNVFVVEDKRGLEVLVRSKYLVTGKLWALAGRFFVFSLMMGVIAIPASIVSGMFEGMSEGLVVVGLLIQGLVGVGVSVITIPLTIIFSFVMYRELVEMKGEEGYDPEEKKGFYKLLLVLGVVLMGLVLAAVVGTIGYGLTEL